MTLMTLPPQRRSARAWSSGAERLGWTPRWFL